MWMAAGGVLLALLAAGVGVPIPEDLTMLSAGYLAWQERAPLWLMWATALIGTIAGDSSLYWIGRKLGPTLTRHKWLSHRLTPSRLARVEGFFHRHGAKAVFAARWASGARGAFFMTAGIIKLPYRRFFVIDSLAALFSVTLWVSVGWRFGAHIDRVRHLVKRVEHSILAVVLMLIGFWLLSRLVVRIVEGPPEAAA